MQYIILDLEWNQPISYQSQTYRRVGDRLMFEMIQIGAVRLDADRQLKDSISIPIAPTQYVRIHPRIRRMTGLDEDTLADAPGFREALEQFAAWCGENYCLMTWGCDDVSVLWQNIVFYGCQDIQLNPLCDLQRLFSDVHQLKDRMGLKPAMEMLGISPDASMAFHNALNDAWYTALVFQTLPDPDAVLNYPQKPRNLLHSRKSLRERTPSAGFDSIPAALASEAASQPLCPRCRRKLTMDGAYVRQQADRYTGLARCGHHGRVLIRLRFRPDDDGRVQMTRTLSPATSSDVAYIHTKQLQQKEAAP